MPNLSSATVVADPGIGTRSGDSTGSGSGDGRIRCPHCRWSPGANDHWRCACGHSWNTFDTGGVCPECLHQWSKTQCPKCSAWSAHSEWYPSY